MPGILVKLRQSMAFSIVDTLLPHLLTYKQGMEGLSREDRPQSHHECHPHHHFGTQLIWRPFSIPAFLSVYALGCDHRGYLLAHLWLGARSCRQQVFCKLP